MFLRVANIKGFHIPNFGSLYKNIGWKFFSIYMYIERERERKKERKKERDGINMVFARIKVMFIEIILGFFLNYQRKRYEESLEDKCKIPQ